MASEYRKRKGVTYDTWHFCTNCSQWPTTNYVVATKHPSSGELCNECKAKRDRGDCK